MPWPEPKFVQLHERLYTRGHTRGYEDKERLLNAIQDRDIRLVLNVSSTLDGLLQHACATVGIEYQHEPLHDGKRIDEPKVRALIDKVADAMKHYSVLVHGDHGRDRSMLIAVPAIAILTGKSGLNVLGEVRGRRPRAVANEAFETFIIQYC